MPQQPQVRNNTSRVLQVFGNLDRGGAESWLYHVLRHWDDQRIQCDILVHKQGTAALEAEFKELGIAVLHCPYPSNPIEYWRSFKRLITEHGPYDILHSHLNYRAGFVLALAHRYGIPVRVAHSHNDTSVPDSAPYRRPYVMANRALVRRFATHGLATSAAAAAAMYGRDWRRDGRWRLHYSCVDLKRFRAQVDRLAVRSRFGVSSEALVVGHVGRFTRQKNHSLLLDIAAELGKRGTDFKMFLVGSGARLGAVLRRLAHDALQSRVRVLPPRDDVPELMQGLFDVFVFPSLFEGLGLAAVEAQAAGLPCVISDAVPAEAVFARDRVFRVTLGAGVDAWCDAILSAARLRQCCPGPVEVPRAFDITSNARDLAAFYQMALSSTLEQHE